MIRCARICLLVLLLVLQMTPDGVPLRWDDLNHLHSHLYVLILSVSKHVSARLKAPLTVVSVAFLHLLPWLPTLGTA